MYKRNEGERENAVGRYLAQCFPFFLRQERLYCAYIHLIPKRSKQDSNAIRSPDCFSKREGEGPGTASICTTLKSSSVSIPTISLNSCGFLSVPSHISSCRSLKFLFLLFHSLRYFWRLQGKNAYTQEYQYMVRRNSDAHVLFHRYIHPSIHTY